MLVPSPRARWVAYAEQGGPGTPPVGLAAWVGAYIWMPWGSRLATGGAAADLSDRQLAVAAVAVRRGRAALIFTGVALLLAFTTNEPIESSYPGFTNPLGVFPWMMRQRRSEWSLRWLSASR